MSGFLFGEILPSYMTYVSIGLYMALGIAFSSLVLIGVVIAILALVSRDLSKKWRRSIVHSWIDSRRHSSVLTRGLSRPVPDRGREPNSLEESMVNLLQRISSPSEDSPLMDTVGGADYHKN